MPESKKSRLQKKLEMLRKTQEITSFVEQSSIKSIATLGGAGDSQPVEESHALSLLDEEPSGGAAKSVRKHAKRPAIVNHHRPKIKAKKRRRAR